MPLVNNVDAKLNLKAAKALRFDNVGCRTVYVRPFPRRVLFASIAGRENEI